MKTKYRIGDIIECVHTRKCSGQSTSWAELDGIKKGYKYRITGIHPEFDWFLNIAIDIEPVDDTPPLTVGYTHSIGNFKKATP